MYLFDYIMGIHVVCTSLQENTRAAFQSVESVVGAFASVCPSSYILVTIHTSVSDVIHMFGFLFAHLQVSMMLESTYFAVHSCFRY